MEKLRKRRLKNLKLNTTSVLQHVRNEAHNGFSPFNTPSTNKRIRHRNATTTSIVRQSSDKLLPNEPRNMNRSLTNFHRSDDGLSRPLMFPKLHVFHMKDQRKEVKC